MKPRHTKAYINGKLGLMQGFYWAGYCVILSFLVPLLKGWGYSDFAIGMLTMLMALTNMSMQIFWGMYCDRKGYIKGVFISQILLSVLVISFLPFGAASGIIVTLLVIAISATLQAMAPMLDSWSVKLQNEGHAVNYGFTRSFGSLFFAVTAVLFGFLLDATGDWIRLLIYMSLVAVLIIIALRLQNPIHITSSTNGQASHLFEALSLLRRNKQYVGFVVSVFLMYTGSSVSIVFYPLLIQHLGGSYTDLGLGWFVMAMSEVPVMLLFAWFLRKGLQEPILLMIGMFFFGVKTLSLALSPNVTWAISLKLLEGLSFALYLPAAIQYVNQIVDRKVTVTAQMVLAAVYGGLCHIVGNFVGGWLSEQYGVNIMMQWMSSLSFIGTGLFVVVWFKYRNSKITIKRH